jgi:hypothetical protein
MVDAGIAVNKLLVFADDDTNAMPTLRAAAEKKFGGRCAITTAVPGMLEFLPLGASKGAAVAKLLKRLDIDPANVLALGDGENDVEMLRLAGTSVAMGGSSALVVDAARGNVGASNDDNGVAEAIETYVLSTRGLPPASEMGKVRVDVDEGREAAAAWTRRGRKLGCRRPRLRRWRFNPRLFVRSGRRRRRRRRRRIRRRRRRRRRRMSRRRSRSPSPRRDRIPRWRRPSA